MPQKWNKELNGGLGGYDPVEMPANAPVCPECSGYGIVIAVTAGGRSEDTCRKCGGDGRIAKR